MRAENGSSGPPMYGATNQAFIPDSSPDGDKPFINEPGKPHVQIAESEMVQEKPEDERESWDSKLTFLLATIG